MFAADFPSTPTDGDMGHRQEREQSADIGGGKSERDWEETVVMGVLLSSQTMA